MIYIPVRRQKQAQTQEWIELGHSVVIAGVRSWV